MTKSAVIPIVIPVYNPPELFVPFVKRLRKAISPPIIVVNDGSSAPFRSMFTAINQLPDTMVIGYRKNAGKGAALKYAMRHLRQYASDLSGIITVDADGQHETDDVRTCLAAAKKNPYTLLIGTRLPRKHMPLRSRTGNALTRTFLYLLHRFYVKDTQSGLRYIPTSLMSLCEASTYNAYDFELDMIIRALRTHIAIGEFPMRPIYINKNKSSHFKSVKDSLFVARVFYHHFRTPVISRQAK